MINTGGNDLSQAVAQPATPQHRTVFNFAYGELSIYKRWANAAIAM